MPKRESDRILERLLKLHPKIIDLSLDRMKDILHKLGNPQKKLPPVIHVAGTNGKGSTTAYLRSILESANLSVHAYTSPHLVNFNERIRLAGKIIKEDYLQEILSYCEEVNGGVPITYFEITTAAAFKAFADTPADILILEVGLGGRLDATNMVERPLSTVLTPISLDHEQFLGSDLSGIAMEKANIAKKGVPLVTGAQEYIVINKITEIVRQKNAFLINDWSFEDAESGFLYKDKFGQLTLPFPNLIGPHQISNAALAIATLRHQNKFEISIDNYKTGITNAKWPARMQNITDSPFGRLLPTGSELWLDGGHNPAAADVIAQSFKKEKITLICGMLKNKNAAEYLRILKPITKELFGINIDGEDSHSAEDIIAFANQINLKAYTAKNTKTALEQISKNKPVKVLICGSLYLAGQILGDNNLIPE